MFFFVCFFVLLFLFSEVKNCFCCFFFIFNKQSVGGIHALGELYQSAPLTSGQGRRAKKEKYTIV